MEFFVLSSCKLFQYSVSLFFLPPYRWLVYRFVCVCFLMEKKVEKDTKVNCLVILSIKKNGGNDCCSFLLME